MPTKKTIDILRRDGYHVAADMIEQLRSTISYAAEFDYITNFVKECNFKEDQRDCLWLRALWTAFCLHQDLLVDTSEYDRCLNTLWNAVLKNEDCAAGWKSYVTFGNFMCEYLV